MEDHEEVPEYMRVTPERAYKIKLALIKQYEHQYGVKVIGWVEGDKVTMLPEK